MKLLNPTALTGMLTLSIGAVYDNKHEDADSLVKRADICLYRAKHGGKNQTAY